MTTDTPVATATTPVKAGEDSKVAPPSGQEQQAARENSSSAASSSAAADDQDGKRKKTDFNEEDDEQEEIFCAPVPPTGVFSPSGEPVLISIPPRPAADGGSMENMETEGQPALPLDEVREELDRIRQRLPKLRLDLESPEHVEMLIKFRTEPCDLPLRQCLQKRGKGCPKFHNSQHFRRPILQEDGETLAYFDMLCRFGDHCPLMMDCPFAHSKTELLVHPAKFKTRCCDSFKCFDDNCCFVHEGDRDRREFAVQYSFVTEAHPEEFVPITAIPGNEDYVKPKGGKLCGSFPTPQNCQYGNRCRFAHKRPELGNLLFTAAEENVKQITDEFLILKYKTKWCPHLYQHNWTYCVYAHNYQDYRRNPQVGYGPVPCPFWDPRDTAKSAYNLRCRFGTQCPFSHGSKERAYHPLNFKVSTCQDIGPKDCRRDCTREPFCAFYHDNDDKREITPHVMNYSKPLPIENIIKFLQKDFFDAGIGYNHNAKRLNQGERLEILKSGQLSPAKKACLLDGVNFVQPISNLRPFRDSVRNAEKASLQKELVPGERNGGQEPLALGNGGKGDQQGSSWGKNGGQKGMNGGTNGYGIDGRTGNGNGHWASSYNQGYNSRYGGGNGNGYNQQGYGNGYNGTNSNGKDGGKNAGKKGNGKTGGKDGGKMAGGSYNKDGNVANFPSRQKNGQIETTTPARADDGGNWRSATVHEANSHENDDDMRNSANSGAGNGALARASAAGAEPTASETNGGAPAAAGPLPGTASANDGQAASTPPLVHVPPKDGPSLNNPMEQTMEHMAAAAAMNSMMRSMDPMGIMSGFPPMPPFGDPFNPLNPMNLPPIPPLGVDGALLPPFSPGASPSMSPQNAALVGDPGSSPGGGAGAHGGNPANWAPFPGFPGTPAMGGPEQMMGVGGPAGFYPGGPFPGGGGENGWGGGTGNGFPMMPLGAGMLNNGKDWGQQMGQGEQVSAGNGQY
eukprot:g3509.t1